MSRPLDPTGRAGGRPAVTRRLALALLLAAALPAAARAAGCEALAVPGAVEAQIRGPADRAAVQAGLRAVFGADDGPLQDGIVGPVTLGFLGELCETVPLAAGTEPVAGVLDLARRYAALARLAPGWPQAAAAPALLAEAGGDAGPYAGPDAGAFRGDVLRLAGAPATAAAALRGGAPAGDCGGLDGLALGAVDLAALQAGAAALLAADPGLGAPPAPLAEAGLGPATRAALARVCAAYPPAGGATGLADDLVRLGRIVAADPEAARLLGAPGFARWLAAEPAVRTTRLLGTPPAVLALLADYRAGGPTPLAAAPLAVDCPAGDPDAPTYYALEPADLEALAARAGLAEALAPVAAERFPDRENLVAAIGKVLGVAAPDCGARLVEAVVARHAPESMVYSLDAGKLQDLALRPLLGGLLPAVTPLEGIEAGSREELVAGLEVALRGAAGASAGAAAGAAADAAAAAAEDVSPAPDAPAPGIPPAEAEGERPQEFAITDAALVALQAELPDPDFLAAITASPYHPVASRELVRAEMAAALRPAVAARSADLTAAGLEEILPRIRERWRLAEAVTGEIAAAPAFAAVRPDVLAGLGALSGLAYPNVRLFDRALVSLALPLDAATREAILGLALKRIDDPYARRKVAPVAAEDCGCNVERRENSLVYGFYPFWRYGFADPAAAPRVDFGLVGRIAFDGLLLDRNADLRFAPQWNDAAASFTASAHRHQALVDLGIRMTGWRDWNEAQVRAAADHVIEELGRTRRTDVLLASAGPAGRLDGWFDRRADGVTFYAEGYTGNPVTGGKADTLVRFLRMVAAGIAGSGQSINLAVDVPLGEGTHGEEPLFQDIRKLIVNVDDPEARVVSRVLVFLERRTSASKKLLRQRIENSFHGEDRIQVLRSLVPVVPPAGALPAQGAAANVADGAVEASSYLQFTDDLVYFQDNFAGIGFWPAPAAAAEGGSDRLATLVAQRYYGWSPRLVPAAVRQPVRDGIDGVCTLVCPNRLAFHVAGAAMAAAIGALLLLGLYSGRIRNLSRRLLLVPALMVGLLALLLVIVGCDASSLAWAPGAILAMVAAMSGSVIFHWYERRLDGPMP